MSISSNSSETILQMSNAGYNGNISLPGGTYNLDPTTWVVIIFYALICLSGLLGNGLVIFVILRYNQLKTVTNIYILNLSIADSLFLIALPMLITTAITNQWVFSSKMCKFYYTLTCINHFTSTYTLTAMAVDRYLAACHPIAALTYRSVKHTLIVITCTWIISFIVMLPVIVYAQVVDSSCTILWPGTTFISGSKTFIIYSMLMAFVLPVVLICTFYTLTMSRLRLRHCGVHSQVILHQRYLQFRRATRLVTLIIVMYITCWLPYWILQIYLISRSSKDAPPDWMFRLYQFFTILTYSNSMLNPLLYAFTNSYFRSAFAGTFKCLPEMKLWDVTDNDKANDIPLDRIFNERSKNALMNATESERHTNCENRISIEI